MLLLQVAQEVASARDTLPTMSQLVTAGAPALAKQLAILAHVLWAIVYILAIIIGHRQKTYAIPMVAIGLNVNWEIVHTAIHPPALLSNLISNFIWLTLDLIIVTQLIRFGRERQPNDFLRRYFGIIVVAVMGLALVGHITFYNHVTANAIFPDHEGVVSAFIINLVMSVLFIGLYFARPNGEGLSKAIAWLKMLGTAALSLANVLAFEAVGRKSLWDVQVRAKDVPLWRDVGKIGPETIDPGFLYFLFVAILIFDVAYLVLLYRRPRTA